MSVVEAWDWIRFADQYGEKLRIAFGELESRRDLEREKTWMESVISLIEEASERAKPILENMRALPEMSAAREEHAAQQIGPWVDALEKLLAGITFHFGSRAPVIEALFPHQKFAGLRRGNLDEARAFSIDFERRLTSSYVERIFAQDEYAFARDVVATIRATYAAIGASAEVAPLSEEERARISEEAIAAGARIEHAIAQARLVAEASLLSIDGAFANAGLNAKPKKRAIKVSESDVPSAVVETAPEPEPEAEAIEEPELVAEPEPEPQPLPKKKRSKKAAASPDAT